MSTTLPERRVTWRPCVRLVSAEYPPVRLIEDAADATELDVAMELLALTDPESIDAIANFRTLPHEDRLTGAGFSDAMTPFLFTSTGRFSEPSFGAWYAAESLDTAIAEVRFHRERALRVSGTVIARVEFRVLHADLDLSLVDARDTRDEHPELHEPDPECCEAARRFARELRASGQRGLAYDSVRRTGGSCVALFRPRDVPVPIRDRGTLIGQWSATSDRLEGWQVVTPLS